MMERARHWTALQLYVYVVLLLQHVGWLSGLVICVRFGVLVPFKFHVCSGFQTVDDVAIALARMAGARSRACLPYRCMRQHGGPLGD